MGPPGLDGRDGKDGAIGPAGPKGDRGLVGPIGPPGLDGAAGAQGAPGPVGATGPAGPSGSLPLTTTEVSLGSVPDARRSGTFTIAGTGLTVGKPVFIQQASGPYTGKGTLADEAEMDQVTVTGKVVSPTLIRCFWQSRWRVRGNFKFDYVVGS